MTEQKIQPASVTKPIQLLAAWLVGLLATDGSFLLAASRMAPGSMELAALVWAAIINVPLFLGALFLLQTKFRPELQEDLYYSTYISQKTNQTISVTKQDQRLATVMGHIESLFEASAMQVVPREESELLKGVSFGINEHFVDKEALSDKLLALGASAHTWFGGKEPPKMRVVSISDHLPAQTRSAILSLVEKLGFKRYNHFDKHMEETEEDVLIGSYGDGGEKIPRMAPAAQLKR